MITTYTSTSNGIFSIGARVRWTGQNQLSPVHTRCRFTSSATMSSSISLVVVSDGSIRNHDSENSDASSPSEASCIGLPLAGETNTTSNLRRCRSFPMTTWCPYRASAPRALGISSPSSVSS